ncbi:Arc family DNA-binding protein [Rhizobium laguerreae]|uniref:Arc family DNA-binding protein n=1 Tax=Rhizobium laguerreae TaxID=1076926 RepID=UPI001C903E14|nr:Arc family DNA-binding protein [Rhizobium laguerreae]MBY3268641.1 Arc family DNA-binding protein [Rhizobium laguerreae]
MGRIPSRGSDQFVLRFPEGLRDRIREIADRNGRSMNAEIIMRLEDSLAKSGFDDLDRGSESQAGFIELPAGISEEQFAAALNEANRQALGVALKRLGVVVRPVSRSTEGSSEND